jgi:hypothetical protein
VSIPPSHLGGLAAGKDETPAALWPFDHVDEPVAASREARSRPHYGYSRQGPPLLQFVSNRRIARPVDAA